MGRTGGEMGEDGAAETEADRACTALGAEWIRAVDGRSFDVDRRGDDGVSRLRPRLVGVGMWSCTAIKVSVAMG